MITDNISIILGVLLASFSISFGLGSRKMMQHLLHSYYLKKIISIGTHILLIDEKIEGKNHCN
ncbi:hypothetical protein AB4865_12300 [Capnocytophaga sp. ARDL2]|uniref:hypothetical protein n=1 Tax=Capnocytophaga sp. ARDL2 TaxID=3238809 RepID=UPI003557CF01